MREKAALYMLIPQTAKNAIDEVAARFNISRTEAVVGLIAELVDSLKRLDAKAQARRILLLRAAASGLSVQDLLADTKTDESGHVSE
jgi:hypothetical protein